MQAAQGLVGISNQSYGSNMPSKIPPFGVCGHSVYANKRNLRGARHRAQRADFSSKVSTTDLDTFVQRTSSSSADKNAPFLRSSTMLMAACSPTPGMDVNGGIKPFRHEKAGRVRFVNVHRLKVEAALIKLVYDLQRSCGFLFRRGNGLFALFHRNSWILSTQTLSPRTMHEASKPLARMEKYAE